MTAPQLGLIVREFQPGDEEAFRTLNEEWITRYFVLEEKDSASLRDPHGKILDRGGRIFFAVRGNRAVGCCALVPMGAGEFEVAKMAVTESARGGGIGRKVLERVVAEARATGARRLYLETNHVLETAVHLYESVGFRHVPKERIIPSPYARADVYMELWLGGPEDPPTRS
jgi:GNAT superfamily N-acetyltransferase